MRDEDERAIVLAEAVGDFRKFCRTLAWISPKEGERTTLRWNPIQSIYCANRTWRDIVLKPRQVGLTTLEMARDVWLFLQRGQRVLVIVQSQTDHQISNEISTGIQRMIDGLRAAGLHMPLETETRSTWRLPDRDSSLTLIEAGASQAAASKKGRGGTLTRVHASEVAFWEYPEDTLTGLLKAVPEMPHTSVVFESTPNGEGNYFHSQFTRAQAGQSSYRAHFFPWFDVAEYRTALDPGEIVEPNDEYEANMVRRYRISPEQLKWYQAQVRDSSPDKAKQEYATDPVSCFLASGRKYFDMGALARIAGDADGPVRVEKDGW